jgi:hypothetical protein
MLPPFYFILTKIRGFRRPYCSHGRSKSKKCTFILYFHCSWQSKSPSSYLALEDFCYINLNLYKYLLLVDSTGGPQEKRLLGSLLSDYNSLNRPVLNESEALMLTFGVTLQQIIDVVSTREQISPSNEYISVQERAHINANFAAAVLVLS